MKLESYEILDETINLIFDKQFKQIKYLKFTSKSDKSGELDCDKTEIKFTKSKTSINVYKEDYALFIFYIKEIDNNKCDYVYYINVNNQKSNVENKLYKNEIENDIGVGLSKLFSGFEEKTIEKKWECVIKNRNIFANIRKKINNGNTKTN
jgi:hypothetical protein